MTNRMINYLVISVNIPLFIKQFFGLKKIGDRSEIKLISSIHRAFEMGSQISKRKSQATTPKVPFSALLFNVEDSVLIENQQQIIAACGGFRALLSAALSEEALQFEDTDTNVLSKYASRWEPNISPLINNVTKSLCDLIASHGWMCRVDTKYASHFEEKLAQMIYDFAAKREVIIKLPPPHF